MKKKNILKLIKKMIMEEVYINNKHKKIEKDYASVQEIRTISSNKKQKKVNDDYKRIKGTKTISLKK